MLQKALRLGVVFLFSLAVAFSWWTPTALAFTDEQKLVLHSWRIVNQSYVDETFNHQNWWLIRQKFLKKPLKTKEEAYTAIESMLATLDDPFTRLLRPEQYKSLQISTAGELSGVGLQININPQTKHIEVISPLSGSPAEMAGIKPKDQILKINGIDTATLTLDEAAAMMRGEIGTKVLLTLQPAKTDTIKNVEIVRDRVALNSVYATLKQEEDKSIGYIRLSQFSASAAQEVAKAIKDLEQQGAESYILDLRNNPGGLLQAGVEIARLWLDPGSTIVYTVNRQGVLGSFENTSEPITQAPLVVLVNQGSASASEILSGALQDNGRALLVGEKTFGKGLIQSLFELPDDSALAVTVAKYETPNHKDINKLGIMPDNVVPLEQPLTYFDVATEMDNQYEVAVELLTSDSVVANAK